MDTRQKAQTSRTQLADGSIHQEVDVLVAGAGAGGMTAALVAAIEGAEVLLCESSTQVGGTAATSAGTIWIPGNDASRAAGFEDSADAGRKYLDSLIGRNGREAVRDVYLETAPQVVEYLQDRSQVQFVPCGMHPDYQDLPGAATTGRALAPRAFDGRTLGRDAFARVRSPIADFLVLGGMMAGKDDIPRLVGRFRSIGNFVYASRLFLRYVTDRLRGFGRGTRVVMGNALVARLYASLLDRKVPVLFQARVEELLWEGDRVAGAAIRLPDRTVRIRARKGVVLATGGFAHDAAMRRRWMPSPTPLHTLACPSNQGDGIRLACDAGGQVSDVPGSSGAFWTPVSVTRNAGQPWGGLFPHLSLDRAKPGLIAVNSAGRRFVNEAVSYHDFVLAMFESHHTVPTMPAYLVCDAAFIRKYGLGLIYPGTSDLKPHIREGYLACADTLAELAKRIGVDASGLTATVARYNGFASRGEDPDFGKGSTVLNRFNGDATQTPNPCLAPIGPGPFCAMAVWPAEIACSSGIQADADARVLAADGCPVGGLYACGNDMASVMDGTYPGPGTTLGPAMAFGYRAVQHALGEPGSGKAHRPAAATVGIKQSLQHA